MVDEREQKMREATFFLGGFGGRELITFCSPPKSFMVKKQGGVPVVHVDLDLDLR